MFHSKIQKSMTYIVFGVYFLLLIWLILFKFSADISELSHIRGINLIPFHYATEVSASLHIREVLYNVLVFVPLGVYIALLKPDWSFVKKALPAFLLSLLLELTQYIFAIGASDITDVIANSIGGLLGIGLFILLKRLFKKQFLNIINGIGITVEVIAIAMLLLLFISNR